TKYNRSAFSFFSFYLSSSTFSSPSFFFNDTATTEIYTLSLHDALPICGDDVLGRAGDILPGDRGDHCRRGLERGALHVMLHAPDAAHFLAAAGATGAAVNQHRQWRSMAGRFGGVGAIDHQHPAMMSGGSL